MATQVSWTYRDYVDFPAPLTGTWTYTQTTVTGFSYPLLETETYTEAVVSVLPANLGALTRVAGDALTSGWMYATTWDASGVTIARVYDTVLLATGQADIPSAYSDGTTLWMIPTQIVPCLRYPGHASVYAERRSGFGDVQEWPPRPTYERAAGAPTMLPSLPVYDGVILMTGRYQIVANPGESWTPASRLHAAAGAWSTTPGATSTWGAIPVEPTSSGPTSVRRLPPPRPLGPSTTAASSTALNQPAWRITGVYQGTGNAREYITGSAVVALSGTAAQGVDAVPSGRDLAHAINGIATIVPLNGLSQVIAMGLLQELLVENVGTASYDTYSSYIDDGGVAQITLNVGTSGTLDPSSIMLVLYTSGGYLTLQGREDLTFDVLSDPGGVYTSGTINASTGVLRIVLNPTSLSATAYVDSVSYNKIDNADGIVTTSKGWGLYARIPRLVPYCVRWASLFNLEFGARYAEQVMVSADDVALPVAYDHTDDPTGMATHIGPADDLAVLYEFKSPTRPISTSPWAESLIAQLPRTRLVHRDQPAGYRANDIQRPHRLPLGYVAVDGGGTILEPGTAIQGSIGGAAFQYGGWPRTVRFRVTWEDGVPDVPGAAVYVIDWDPAMGTYGTWYQRKVRDLPTTIIDTATLTSPYAYTLNMHEITWDPSDDGLEFCAVGAGVGSYCTLDSSQELGAETLPAGPPPSYRVGRFLGGNDDGDEYLHLDGYIPTAMLTADTGHNLVWHTYEGTPSTATGTIDTVARTLTLSIASSSWIIEPTTMNAELCRPANIAYDSTSKARWQVGLANGYPQSWNPRIVIISDDVGRYLQPSAVHSHGTSEWTPWASEFLRHTVAGVVTTLRDTAVVIRPADATVRYITVDVWIMVSWRCKYSAIPVTRRFLRTYVADMLTGSFTMTRDTYPA